MALATLFCPGCGADVEDVGGFCLLGHRLAQTHAGLEDLHAEIATAFEAAQGKVDNALRLSAVTTPMPSGRLPMDTTPLEAPVDAPAALPVGLVPPTPLADAPPPPPAPSPVWGAPPPPPAPDIPPEHSAPYWDKVWGANSPEDVLGDPITNFAPAPSMNWGPEQSKGRSKLRRLRKGA